MDYFFSGWISNLGVVPLLLLAAFLLFPDFTFFADLLFLVIRVFETISQLQFSTSIIYQSLKKLVLPTRPLTVKILFLFSAICPIHMAQADSQPTESTTFLFSIGEHREISFKGTSRYSITNKDILSHKLKDGDTTLLVKGKKLGFTEIIIWKKNREKKVYRIYILEKRRQLKILHLGETFEQMGLKIKLLGPIIEVSGFVDDLPTYQKVKELFKANKNQMVLRAQLSRNLKTAILSDIYKKFLDQYIDSIECSSFNLDIECTYSNHTSFGLEKDLINKYSIQFNNTGIENRNINYRLSFKLTKVDVTAGRDVRSGLESYSGVLDDLIKKNYLGPLRDKTFNIEGINGRISTLAKPSILVTPGVEAMVSLGAEIPYDAGRKKGTAWKFAGMKIKTTIIPNGKNFLCEFKIKMSKPSQSVEQGFEENSQSSKIIIPEGIDIQAFNIQLTSDGISKEGLPILSQIPLLGKIFTSTNTFNSTQRIIAHVRLERLSPNGNIR